VLGVPSLQLLQQAIQCFPSFNLSQNHVREASTTASIHPYSFTRFDFHLSPRNSHLGFQKPPFMLHCLCLCQCLPRLPLLAGKVIFCRPPSFEPEPLKRLTHSLPPASFLGRCVFPVGRGDVSVFMSTNTHVYNYGEEV
jgi:hypothetical protein